MGVLVLSHALGECSHAPLLPCRSVPAAGVPSTVRRTESVETPVHQPLRSVAHLPAGSTRRSCSRSVPHIAGTPGVVVRCMGCSYQAVLLVKLCQPIHCGCCLCSLVLLQLGTQPLDAIQRLQEHGVIHASHLGGGVVGFLQHLAQVVEIVVGHVCIVHYEVCGVKRILKDYLRRSLIAWARRTFSRWSLGIITISGAVLCDQSRKPTYDATREQPTQVVVLGRASSRIAGISQPHLAQLRMGIPRERLLDCTALHLGCAVLLHSTLLGDATAIAERLAHLLAGQTHGCTFTLCLDVELVDVSLGHGGIVSHRLRVVKRTFRLFHSTVHNVKCSPPHGVHRHIHELPLRVSGTVQPKCGVVLHICPSFQQQNVKCGLYRNRIPPAGFQSVPHATVVEPPDACCTFFTQPFHVFL